MVYVNEKKFACESCIKGHRSSSCHHSERPLFEVKKKGRPVSQCPRCRELRHSKRVHSKCTCNSREVVDKVPIPAARPDKKPKRFMPTVPTLPNGISDALSTFPAVRPADARQTVDSLLNPCRCEDVWQCRCRNTPGISSAPRTESSSNGLAALAEAAALFYDDIPLVSAQKGSTVSSQSCCAKDTHPTDINIIPSARFDLPPVGIYSPIPTASSSSKTVPKFPVIPPFSSFNSIAGSGCTCGLRCACPGCAEHRGPVHASKDCAEGCHHCVDHSLGVELPTSGQGPSRNSMIDQFFTRAAALPSPPANRKVGVEFDPTDITVYPAVTVPKLECCGGRCSCPYDGCRCGQSCDGCSGGECVQGRSEPFGISDV
ncbi:copper-fist-domain-containing protein [Rhizopogon vinicolor AM-OR11-026]|uniref:Copper-fist-domain-containing protein n=1 Tax=Rhizopogon vinicolor AM-OR11-026 TaxID=1314800 RepID=A0A1B7MRN2_9AGAM|nr:copper-fist-domain-containing protein [Rhizopogon vinicolor AM-OR11-026]